MKHSKPNIAGFYILPRHKAVINNIAAAAASDALDRAKVQALVAKLIRASVYRASDDNSGIITVYVRKTGASYQRQYDSDFKVTTNKSLVSFYKES